MSGAALIRLKANQRPIEAYFPSVETGLSADGSLVYYFPSVKIGVFADGSLFYR